jgi:hypothetical protein
MHGVVSITGVFEFLKMHEINKIECLTHRKGKSALQDDLTQAAKSTEEVLDVTFSDSMRQIADVDTSRSHSLN